MVMAFRSATIAQLYRMVELTIPGRYSNVMIVVGTNNVSRGSDVGVDDGLPFH